MNAAVRKPRASSVTPDDAGEGFREPVGADRASSYGGDYSPYVWQQLGDIQKNLGSLGSSVDRLSQDCGAIGGINQAIGEIRSDAATLKVQSGVTQTEVKDLVEKIDQLKITTSSQLSFVKGVAWALGIAFVAVSGGMAWMWASVIKPGLAHAIVEQIKPEISKQVTEAVKQTSGTGPVRK